MSRFKTYPVCVFVLALCVSIASAQQWVHSIGGSTSNEDRGNKIAIDGSGNVYIVGDFCGANVDFDPGPGTAYLSSHSGSLDFFMAKYNAEGEYLWAYNIGGSGQEHCPGMTIDGVGNIYVTGFFTGTDIDFDPGVNIANLSSSGSADIFIAKYDKDGFYQWAHAIGGSSQDSGARVAVDDFGNIYITGTIEGSNIDFDPGAGTAFLSAVGYYDGYFAKYSTDGVYQWAHRIGGSNHSGVKGIALDDNNNVYITGFFESTNVDFDPGAGTHYLSTNGSQDIFFAKYTMNGEFQWAHNIGSSGAFGEMGYDLVVDGSNNVYVAGHFSAPNVDFNPGPGVNYLSTNGTHDIFLAKYNTDGIYQWAYNLGGSSVDLCMDMSIDDTDNIYLTGHFESNMADFNPGTETAYLSSAGSYDIFYAKYDSDGEYQWAYNIGSSGYDGGNAIAVDNSGHVYVTGKYRESNIDFDPGPGTTLLSSNGAEDIFFGKYRQSDGFLQAPAVAIHAPDTLSIVPGSSLSIPIYATDIITTDDMIQGYEFELCINDIDSILTFVDASTDGSLSDGWFYAANMVGEDTLRVSAAGSDFMAGTGPIIYLNFLVSNNYCSVTRLDLNYFTFNAGTPETELFDGSVSTQCFQVSGSVNYFASTEPPVPDVVLTMTPGDNGDTSGADGTYNFLTGAGTVIMTASRGDEVTSTGVSGLDASYILRYRVGLMTLTPDELIAAEVTDDGSVTVSDAVQILNYTVGNPPNPNCGGSTVGQWFFKDNARTVSITDQNMTEDWVGILKGDVTGNLIPQPNPLAKSTSSKVELSVGSMKASPGDTVLIPVTSQQDLTEGEVFAIKATVEYDAEQLTLLSIKTKESLSKGWYSAVNDETHTFALCGATPWEGKGPVCFLEFVANGKGAIPVNLLNPLLNEGEPACSVLPGEVTVETTGLEGPNTAIPKQYTLHANYPNPFNPTTHIGYEMPKQGTVTLAIYNIQGQLIRMLENSTQSAGRYAVTWDGKDEKGQCVSTGMYFYRLKVGDVFNETRVMTLMR